MSNTIYDQILSNSFKESELMSDPNFELVHYTSAEALVNILRSRTFWLRPTYNMNDYSEGLHGLDYLNQCYTNEKLNFKKLIEDVFPGKSESLHSILNEYIDNNRLNTFVGCLSQHKQEENSLGRLSMWRAYGKGSGVAIVLNHNNFYQESQDSVIFSKVSYDDQEKYFYDFCKLVSMIEKNKNEIRNLGFESFARFISVYFLIKISTQKHPGFREEIEWRLIHIPNIFPLNHVKESVQLIGGIPQRIYELELDKSPEPLNFNTLIDKIIIGPCKDGLAVYDSLLIEMKKAGISNPHEKIVRSNIPLRID